MYKKKNTQKKAKAILIYAKLNFCLLTQSKIVYIPLSKYLSVYFVFRVIADFVPTTANLCTENIKIKNHTCFLSKN